MNNDPAEQALRVAKQLEDRGHAEAAARLHAAIQPPHHGSLLLEALREVCQTVLTTIEAVDPACAAMIEELRMDVDKRLLPHPQ